jgi:cytochrome c553
MGKMLRWIAYGFAAVATVVVFVGLGGFAASEVMYRRTYAAPVKADFTAARDPAAIARGKRIATVNGCHDCHGETFAGKLFHDEPQIVRAWAPNLTLAAASQTDAQLERAIRHGVAADGRSLWIMPSDAFSELTDRETADLIAYIRTFKTTGLKQPALQVGPVGRVGLVLGKFASAPAMLAADAERYRPDLGPQYAQGRDLARACVECHGKDLKGREITGAPDLAVAAAYAPEDFEHLLRTGEASGGRRLGLMSEIAPVRFNAFSHQEIVALQDYLRARADKGL